MHIFQQILKNAVLSAAIAIAIIGLAHAQEQKDTQRIDGISSETTDADSTKMVAEDAQRRLKEIKKERAKPIASCTARMTAEEFKAYRDDTCRGTTKQVAEYKSVKAELAEIIAQGVKDGLQRQRDAERRSQEQIAKMKEREDRYASKKAITEEKDAIMKLAYAGKSSECAHRFIRFWISVLDKGKVSQSRISLVCDHAEVDYLDN